MKPYWMWSIDANLMVDVGKAEYIYWHEEHEKSLYVGFTVRAKVEKGETRTDQDIVLAVMPTEDEAQAFMDELRVNMNSEDEHRPGMPIITKTVSPEAMEQLKKDVSDLAGGLAFILSIVSTSVRDSLLFTLSVIEDSIKDGYILSKNPDDAKATLHELAMCTKELCKITINMEEEKS